MKSITFALFAVLGLVGRVVDAACAGNLVVDDFAKFGSNENTLGQWTSGQYCYYIYTFPLPISRKSMSNVIAQQEERGGMASIIFEIQFINLSSNISR